MVIITYRLYKYLEAKTNRTIEIHSTVFLIILYADYNFFCLENKLSISTIKCAHILIVDCKSNFIIFK